MKSSLLDWFIRRRWRLILLVLLLLLLGPYVASRALSPWRALLANKPVSAPGMEACAENLIRVVALKDGWVKIPPNQRPESPLLTFPSTSLSQSIDWVLASPSWQVSEMRVVPTELSDHLPVVVDLRVRDPDED